MKSKDLPSFKDFIRLLCLAQKIELSDLGDKETLKQELERILILASAKGWIDNDPKKE